MKVVGRIERLEKTIETGFSASGTEFFEALRRADPQTAKLLADDLLAMTDAEIDGLEDDPERDRDFQRIYVLLKTAAAERWPVEDFRRRVLVLF